MPMKSKAFLALLPLLLLSSCGENKVEFPVTDDPDLIYLSRNGNNFKSTANDVKSLSLSAKAADLVNHVKAGESIFVYCHQVYCSSCKSLENSMSAFLRDSEVTCFSLYNSSREDTTIYDGLEGLKKAFPGIAEVIGEYNTYRTPTAYLIKDGEHAVKMDFDETEAQDAKKLEDRFKALANYTAIYEFSKAEPFLSYVQNNDCLFVFDDALSNAGIFQSKVYQYAIHSEKKVARVRFSSLTSVDKATIASKIGNGSGNLAGTVKGGQFDFHNYKENPAAFTELLSTYYNVEIPQESSSQSSSEASASESSLSSAS